MSPADRYTFGDSDLAVRRLELLADLYRPSSQALIQRWRPAEVEHAVDLGCGPGHSTRLLHEVCAARATTGVERSAPMLALARSQSTSGIRYVQHDVAQDPLPVPPAQVIHCRFLLTHLAEPQRALRIWGDALTPGGRLLVQETARLVSAEPALGRYYELVAELQQHHGQALDVGARLPELARAAGLVVEHHALRPLRPPVRHMAALHVMNLRTWRHDSFAESVFDADELDAVDAALVEIAQGRASAEAIEQELGEAVVRLPA